MIAIEKQPPPLSVRLARVNVKMAQVTTIIGAATILTALLFAVLKTAILETILLVTLTPFLILTAITILTTIITLIIAAVTGHLHETWEELIK